MFTTFLKYFFGTLRKINTIVVWLQGNSAGITYVHVYSCGDEVPDIAAALQDTAVPWSTDQLVFDVVYGSVRPQVLQALKSKGTPYTEATLNIYWVSPDEEHKLEERFVNTSVAFCLLLFTRNVNNTD